MSGSIIILPNPNYIKGRAKEYRIKKKLEAEGWTVLRMSGSHGFVDLIAIKPREQPKGELFYDFAENVLPKIKLIQCKSGRSSKREIKKVEDSGLKAKFEGLYQVSVEIV